jgi:hypothetical protein
MCVNHLISHDICVWNILTNFNIFIVLIHFSTSFRVYEANLSSWYAILPSKQHHYSWAFQIEKYLKKPSFIIISIIIIISFTRRRRVLPIQPL